MMASSNQECHSESSSVAQNDITDWNPPLGYCRRFEAFLADAAPISGTITHVETASPSRILGLDHGERRIGVAISDELGLTAQPLLTILHSNRRNDLRALGRLLRRFGCTAIVIGWPIHLSGDRSPRAEAAEMFADSLRKEFNLPVHLWDERLSTAEAHRHLEAAGRGVRDRKDVIDQVAAVLILQSWLDAQRHSPAKEKTSV